MNLTSPAWLWLLAPVVALAVAYVLQQRRRSRYAVRFATLPMLETLLPRRPGYRRHVSAVLMLLCFGVLALAAARPTVTALVPRERATVMVVVDVSLSMQATDVSPDRLTAARAAAQQFIEGLPEGFNVGVVSFAGTATVLDAPGPDHQAAIASLDRLELDEGTAIGDGVLTSLSQIEALAASAPTDPSAPSGPSATPSPGDGATTEEEQVPGQVVLLSDGTNTVGSSLEQAATAATQDGVPVSTIAYGTPDGTVEVQGQTVPVPVDVDALDQLAEATGGRGYQAETADELSEVYDDIRSSIGQREEQKDVTQYVVAAALLLGLLGAAASLRWSSRLP